MCSDISQKGLHTEFPAHSPRVETSRLSGRKICKIQGRNTLNYLYSIAMLEKGYNQIQKDRLINISRKLVITPYQSTLTPDNAKFACELISKF